MSKKLFNKNKLKEQGGFTLLEVIVVVAIFGIMTAVVIFNYSNFSSRVILTNMAYEIALTTRQAQVFGLGARSGETLFVALPAETQFESPFGMFFNLIDGTGPKANTTDQFIMFIDTVTRTGDEITTSDHYCKRSRNGNTGLYVDACTCGVKDGNQDECVNKFQMQRGMYISKIHVFDSDSSTCHSTNKAAISFKRPNPDGFIVDQQAGGSPPKKYKSLQITVTSKSGDNEYVIMRENGQLSVQNTAICS